MKRYINALLPLHISRYGAKRREKTLHLNKKPKIVASVAENLFSEDPDGHNFPPLILIFPRLLQEN